MNLIKKMSVGTNFSAIEKDIIQFIFENSDDILNMTIGELAQQTYSSNAGIIRLCKKLGLSGFRDFKIKYAQDLERHLNNKKFVDVNYPFHMLENPKEISHDIASLTKSAIDTCYKELDTNNLSRISRILFNSNNVYTYGYGDSQIRLTSFANKLLKINKHVINTFNLEPFVYASYATSKDCALFVTYSANNPDYFEYAKIMKARGVTIVTITANPYSALGRLSDYTINFPNLEDPINSMATFYSQIAMEYILNVLYSLIYSIHYAENQQKKSKLDVIRINNSKKN